MNVTLSHSERLPQHLWWWLRFVFCILIVASLALPVDYLLHQFVQTFAFPNLVVDGLFRLGFSRFWVPLFAGMWLVLSLVIAWYRLSPPALTLSTSSKLSNTQDPVNILARDIWRWRGRFGWMFACMGFTMLAVWLFKSMVGRPRPELLDSIGALMPIGWAPNQELYASFPSGHAAVYTVLITMLALHTSVRLRYVLAIFAFAVSLVRVWQGGHYLSDVIVGFGLAVTITFAVTYAMARWTSVLHWSVWDPTNPIRSRIAWR